jgi:hypothetical protein
MDLSDLEKLHAVVKWLLRQDSFAKAIERLRVEETKESLVISDTLTLK